MKWIIKKFFPLFIGLIILLAIPTMVLANSETTTITGTVPPSIDVSISGEPNDLSVNVKSNCDMIVTVTRIGDNVTVEQHEL